MVDWGILAAVILMLGTAPIWLMASFVWSIATFFYACYEMLLPLLSNPETALSDYGMVPVYAFVQSVVGAIAVPVWLWEWASLSHPWWATVIGLLVGAIAAKKL